MTVLIEIEVHVVRIMIHGVVFTGIEWCPVDAEAVSVGPKKQAGGESGCRCGAHHQLISIGD